MPGSLAGENELKKLIDKFNLAGKTALVTGGASGIGLSFSRILAEAGATVMMAARTEERLKKAARMLSDETGSTVLHATVDLSDRADAERLITHARETMGGVDIFVGNAGTEVMETVEHLKDESIDRILAVNLVSNIVMTRALVPDMKKKQWGRIIYISSTTAMIASKHVGHSIYTTSK
jgi:NAD(P)-dependent dehydrogenase (short-subunit alcohol dehydrogenase family)